MTTRFFSGEKADLLPEIEKFRELQAFCSHDLRSQIGAVAGLLQLLEDQLASLDDKTKTSFRAAMTSAQEALENLDANIASAKPHFDSAWLVGFTEAEAANFQLPQVLQTRGLARPKPVLFLNFSAPTDWQPRVKKYRPLAVFFKDRESLGPDSATWINRLGPNLTKIYFLDGARGQLEGVRPESVTLLNASADLPAMAQLVVEALEKVPHGRN